MISIIINPVAGGATPDEARARVELARAVLERHGEPGEVSLTTQRGHAVDLAAVAVARGDRLVVSWGGDGTVNEVASSLVGTRSVLGLVPSGSGNGLARELRIPQAPAAALREAISAAPRRIDAGRMADRWFFSVAGIGFDAHVAAAFDRDGSARRGLSTYVRLTVKALWSYAPARYTIDGGASFPAFLVTAANSAQFGNGIRIAPEARLDDGRLDLVVFEERSRLSTLLNMPRLVTGSVARAPGVTIRSITEAVIECDAPMPFHVDGEPRQGGSRIDVRVVPQALLVAAGGRP